jgi:hypothetical protein
MNELTPYVPLALAALAGVGAVVAAVLLSRNPQSRVKDSLLILTLGVAWVAVGAIFGHESIGSLGSILVIVSFLLWFLNRPKAG